MEGEIDETSSEDDSDMVDEEKENNRDNGENREQGLEYSSEESFTLAI